LGHRRETKKKHTQKTTTNIEPHSHIKQKEIGAWGLLFVDEGFEAVALRLLTSVLGWQKEEVEVLCAEARKELRSKKIHTQYT